jgi:hypothetical protein
MADAHAALKRQLKRNGRSHDDTVRETLGNFFYSKTQSRPVILSNVVRVS